MHPIEESLLELLEYPEEASSLLSIVMVIAADFRGLAVFLLLSLINVCLAATFFSCLHASIAFAADLARLEGLDPMDEPMFVAQMY